MLWFNNVLPALLPFVVIVNMMTSLGVVRKISFFINPFMKTVFKLPGAGGFAFITGLISGYPMGAKAVGDLWQSRDITTKEAQQLLTFCNNAGPLFIVGVIGVGLLGNQTAGYALWAGHIITALIMGLLTRIQRSSHPRHNFPFRVTSNTMMPNIGKALGDAVKNAMDALVVVGGLIIFFSVVTRAITMLAGDLPYIGIIAGIIEVTGGVKILAEGAISPLNLGLIGGVIAFGGFSVHAQALHFTSGTGIKAGQYILFKGIGSIIAGLVTWLIWSLYILH